MQTISWSLVGDPEVLARACATSLPRPVRRTRSPDRLRTLEVIKGSLPKRALSMVLEWAAQHRAEIWPNGADLYPA